MSAFLAVPALLPGVLPGAENPVADFSDTPFWLSIVKGVLIFVYLLLSTLLVIWFERRVIGRMQQRPGPNRNGPFGLLQTLADGMKSMFKEDVRPANADKWVFTIAPLIAATMCVVSFSIIPLGPDVYLFGHRTPLQLTDVPVAVLLVLAVASVGAYGIILAGWSSGSTYPLMGGLRSTAQVISYEIAMGLSLVAVFLFSGSMSTSSIVGSQASMWYVVPAFFSFAVYLVTMVGETNRLPFDLAEGEGEIVGGFHTEYGSMRFAMFFLAEYINMFTVSALATTMFLGGWQAPPIISLINDNVVGGGWWGLLWFTTKLWLFMFFFVWLRGTLPRVRYDQFMHFGWKFLIPVTVTWVVAVAFIRGAQPPLNYFGKGALTIGNKAVSIPLLVIISVIAVIALAATWVWDERANAAAMAAAPEAEEEIDPFAGGFPVPPMPGQRLKEPAYAGPRSSAAAVTDGDAASEATDGDSGTPDPGTAWFTTSEEEPRG